jgi:LysR family transcriptional regulator, transcriptional activator for leuABCD operon
MFNLRSLDLNLLTVFEAIYELGTVSAAADRLALSHSATSHALSRLREACGDDLFVRTHQGVSPTPVAQAMYPVIKQALEALRATLAEARGFDPAQSKRNFRICVPHPMGPFYAILLQEATADVAPGVALTFDTTSRPVNLEDQLRDGIADIAIDWLPIELDPFVNTKIFDDRLMLLARKDHPSVGPDITIEGLRNEKFVMLHPRRHSERWPPAAREFSKLIAHEQIRVSELLEVPTVVAGSDLVGMMPLSIGPLMEKRLGLQVLPAPVELPTLTVYMIWHETRRNDSAHRWLRELVGKKLRGQASS